MNKGTQGRNGSVLEIIIMISVRPRCAILACCTLKLHAIKKKY